MVSIVGLPQQQLRTCIRLSTTAIESGTLGIATKGLANDSMQSTQATFLNITNAFSLRYLAKTQAVIPARIEVMKLKIITGTIAIASPFEDKTVSGINPKILPKRKYIAPLAETEIMAHIMLCESAVENFIKLD